jgi:hypothetical protein
VKRLKATTQELKKAYQRNQLLFIVRTIVIAIAIFILVTQRTFWTPDTLFILLLCISAVFGQARAFIIRFLPLVLLMTLYELFRGFADDLNGTVHFTEMIDFDRWMFFGHLPTVVLQEWWWQGQVQWYDFYFYFLYMIHFLMPALLAVLIWKKKPKHYWQFMWALVGLSFAAFVTYLLFPAAPPWMASLPEHGYITEPMRRISSDIWWAMGVKNFTELYNNIPANQVAAVPSLHSAFPMLFSMFVTGLFGMKRFWWVYIYPISMWVGVTYMGEHYVIDVILGALYAVLAYYASVWGYQWYYAPHRPLRRKVDALMKRLHLSTKA